MDIELSSRLMDQPSLVQAFPLVCSIMPQVTLEHWTRFARGHLAAKRQALPTGLMTIRNRDDYILGLFAFNVRYDLKEYRALWIDNIIISTMPGRNLIWKSTIDAIDALAKANGCGMIRVGFDGEVERTGGDHSWINPALEDAGYLLVGVRAQKRLRP
ncbi:MAG: hypothetical protein ACT4N4_11710 [Rhodospirillales bacterium]